MKMTEQAYELDPSPIDPQPVLNGPLAALLEWQAMAEGAYSLNTLRARKADGAIFQGFCDRRGEPYLPADPKTIRAFIEHETKAGKKPATIKRYVATIGRVHVAAQLLNPCSSEVVRLGLKRMGRETSARQDQAVDITNLWPFRQQLMSNHQASLKEATRIQRLINRIEESGLRIWT